MTIFVNRDDRTLRALTLKPGVTVVGRDASCDLPLDDHMVSRHHCEIRLEDGRTTVTDLHSRNGTRLGESPLPPGQAVTWTSGVALTIGPFVLKQQPPAPEGKARRPGHPRRIICDDANPSVTILADKPIRVGRADECDIVLADSRVSRQQCEIRLQGDQIWVTDLSGRGSTRLGDQPLPEGVAQLWPPEVRLHVGPFILAQSVDAAPAAASAKATPAAAVSPRATPVPAISGATTSPTATPTAPALGRRMWQQWLRQLPWLPITFLMGGACVLLGVGVGLYQQFGPKPAPPTVVPSPSPPVIPPTITPYWTTTPAPSATPVATSIHTSSSDISSLLSTSTPLPTVECRPESAGWLDLPFPYDGQNKGFGDAEQFRQAVQRSASRGRINSFFDHQYPLYTRGEESLDGSQATDTMILFDGSRSLNKLTHPNEVGDFYSGHPGYDFSTYEWHKPTTPVLAPADGTFLAAGRDKYGNTYVWLEHDLGEQGVFRTSYLHLHPDEHLDRMIAMAPGTPIKAGERIGTMGNEGNSSGHHLHFEIRRDCNDDGSFTQDEAVDPFGYLASPENPDDPLTQLACGGGTYLWKYTLVPTEEGGMCAQPERRWQLDPAPFLGYVSLTTFFFSTADPSTPTSVSVWLGKSDVEKLEDLGSIKVHRYDRLAGNWLVVTGAKTRSVEGKVLVEVDLSESGKYVVTGKPGKDIIPPTTTIELSGTQQDGKFVGTVTIQLTGQDEGPDDEKGISSIDYSLDCGQTWQTYADRPLELEPGQLTPCGPAEEAHEDELGLQSDEYLILAAALDWAGNREQPPSQQSFFLLAGDNTP